jgi:hypothetical protein
MAPDSELRFFSPDEVGRITAIVTKADFEELRGSVTVRELAFNEVYPYREDDNPVRVFSELRRLLEELKTQLIFATENNRGIILEIRILSAELLH